MILLTVLAGFYVIQVMSVIFVLITSEEAFQTKLEFIFALTPLLIPYIIMRKIQNLK